MLPFAHDADGLTLPVRAGPRASHSAIGGIIVQPDGRPALTVRIAAPPVDGEANAALIAFLAKALGVSRAAVTLRSGATGRLKIVHVAGDGPLLARTLAAQIAASP